jgi:hypothetical protein
MIDFDPFESAILHDKQTDRIVTWRGEDAPTYTEAAIVRSDATVQWTDFVFDGWGTSWADRDRSNSFSSQNSARRVSALFSSG